MQFCKLTISMTIFFFCLFTNLTMCAFSENIADNVNGYEVIFKKNLSKLLTDKKNAVHPPVLAMSPSGTFFMLEEYSQYFRLSHLDISFKKKKDILISKASTDIKGRMNIKITPLENDELIIQAFKRNANYKETEENKTEPFYYIKVLHFDKDLKITNQIQIPRIGTVLPPLTAEQQYYYMLGNTIHIMLNPIKQKNYLLKVEKSGAISHDINMNDETTDLLVSLIESENIKIFNKSEYIFAANRDIFSKKNFNASSYDLWNKLENNIGIYFLVPEKKSMKKKYDLTDKVYDAYKNINNSGNPKNLLSIVDFHYNKNNQNVIFNLLEFSNSSTCGRILNMFLVKFDLETDNFKMVKLGDEFGRPLLIGYYNNLCYIYNWEKSELFGLKFH